MKLENSNLVPVFLQCLILHSCCTDEAELLPATQANSEVDGKWNNGHKSFSFF